MTMGRASLRRISSTCSSYHRAAGGKASGSGLGLTIASELALRLGGSIELSSSGSTVFTLNLPPAEPGRAQETLWRM